MLTRNLTHSLENHARRATSDCRRWNYGFRMAGNALVPVVLLLLLAGCGGGSAKSSTAKKHAAQRGLYIINTKTGAVDESFPDMGIANYVVVNAAISDGGGGWYIAGNFSHIGEMRRNGLARLRSDGTVDPGFAPRLPKQTPVVGVVRHGNIVFIDTVPSAKKHGYRVSIVAAFDAASGRRLWQVPAEGVSGSGYLAFANGGSGNLAFANGTLFVGGFETMRVAGIPRSGLAALDPKTGKPTSWHVHLASGRKAQGDVEAMSIENGAIYYVGYFKGTETYRGDKGLLERPATGKHPTPRPLARHARKREAE